MLYVSIASHYTFTYNLISTVERKAQTKKKQKKIPTEKGGGKKCIKPHSKVLLFLMKLWLALCRHIKAHFQ